jgi:hypothetical protein
MDGGDEMKRRDGFEDFLDHWNEGRGVTKPKAPPTRGRLGIVTRGYSPRERDPNGPDSDLTWYGRTPESHPYSYDPFTIWGHPYADPTCKGVDYTDRLEQWDYKKYHRILDEVKQGEKFSLYARHNCRGDLIEQLLRKYHDNESIELRRVVEYCNAGTGYPVWCLFYRYTPKEKP